MPTKYAAAIDIGTNSFHLIVAEVNSGGDLRIKVSDREVIRLGSSEGEGLSFISGLEGETAVKILKRFKETADKFGATIKTGATSAVREAANREWFIKKAADEAGIKIDLLTGEDEAMLIYKGAAKALHLGGSNVLCTDIGGGSTELIFSRKGSVEFAESMKLGAVRLSKMFFPGCVLTDESIEACENYIGEIISGLNGGNPSGITPGGSYITVGCSGTIQAAGKMIYYKKEGREPEKINGLKFTAPELEELTDLILSKKTPAERESLPGMEERRADIIPSGLLILKNLFRVFNIKEMVISEYALREGMILEELYSAGSTQP